MAEWVEGARLLSEYRVKKALSRVRNPCLSASGKYLNPLGFLRRILTFL